LRHALVTLAIVLSAIAPGPARAADPAPAGLERWAFVIGEWNLVERRYGSDSSLIETNPGHARFSRVMKGQRIEEFQVTARGDDSTTALQVFAFDPGSGEVEIARTDSGHRGFWVIAGPMSDAGIDLTERHPDPAAQVTRRISYRRIDDDHFVRRLEFSTDDGASWFVRSEWAYTRR